MKTKIFFIALLVFTCFSFQNLVAQSDKAAMQGWYYSEYWSPVVCDGILVDLLEGGIIRVHWVYKPTGLWEVEKIKGEVTSDLTGETFKIRETDRWYVDGNWFVTWTYNLIGDMGSHYHGTLTQNYLTGEITVGKTLCK